MNYFIKHYGDRVQLQQLAKECIELAHSINDHLDEKDSIEHVKEEMGDVSNLIGQFEEHYNDGVIHNWRTKKQERQLKRIKIEKLRLTKNQLISTITNSNKKEVNKQLREIDKEIKYYLTSC